MIKKTFLLALICIPLFGYSQLSSSFMEMKSDPEPDYTKYEQLLFEATEYIFDNPVNFKSQEYVSACRIVDFWKNEDTGVNIPTFGKFYNSLNPKSNQRYFYMVAIMNYILNEKLNNEHILKNTKVEGQKFSEQEDVSESQIGGARIFLDYVSNQENNLPINSKSKKFVKAHKKGTLEDIFFD